MAKRKNKDKKKAPARLPLRVSKHLKALGMSEHAYTGWCRDNGFACSNDKTPQEMEEEITFHQNWLDRYKDIDHALKNPRQLIRDACADKIDCEELTRLKWRSFCRSISRSNARKELRQSLEELLLHVQKHADFLFERIAFDYQTFYYIDALIQLNYRRGQWMRPLKDWKPRSRNRQRQFSSLARHLLAKYPVPDFMDNAWFRDEDGTRKLRDWFILIGDGYNIRTASKLPIPLTKGMAHRFLEAPSHFSVEQAIRWGEIHALGGDRRLIETLLTTRIGHHFENNDFWQTVIRFFIAHPLLHRRHVGPIIDYLYAQKFQIQEIMVAPAVVRQQQPPQPDLTMRGRTPEALLRQVNEWHQDVHKSSSAHGLFFEPADITGWQSNRGPGRLAGWTIRQLLSGSDLIKEGRALNHCVATYAESCRVNECSIWTMEKTDMDSPVKMLTIEVSHANTIIQVRGRHNRLAVPEEFEVIKKWAVKSDLAIDTYLEVED